MPPPPTQDEEFRQTLRDKATRLRARALACTNPLAAHLLKMAAHRYDLAAAEAVAAEHAEHAAERKERGED